MHVNWCFKGIAESADFDDKTAERVVNHDGLLSSWMLAHGANALSVAHAPSQQALSESALDLHVNSYSSVATTTPYISLAAGCVEYRGAGKPAAVLPALATATRFATRRGRTPGYLFRLWVVTSPKPAADIPGLAEDVRDLNLFSKFHRYHSQGEVTAKLYVPRRQVAWVMKIDPMGHPLAASWPGSANMLVNPDFVDPDAVSNLIGSL